MVKNITNDIYFMQGFKNYIESYADFADLISQNPEGPSPFGAVKDLINEKSINDVKKILKIIDMVVGMGKMIGMVPITLKRKLDVLYYLGKVARHPKKAKYWQELASSLAQVGKLTAANPLVLFPAISPLIANLEPEKQGLIIGALKVLSSTYFYISTLADQEYNNKKLQDLFKMLKPLLPDMKSSGQRNT